MRTPLRPGSVNYAVYDGIGTGNLGIRELSLGMTLVFMLVCIGVIAWIFRTGYRLKS